MAKRTKILIGLILALALLVPASASASWGKNCSFGGKEENHCYAIAEWLMKNTGEEVKGVSSEIATTAMSVPNWESGDFITNEQWMSDPNSGRWVEDGQGAGFNNAHEEGREINGASLHWFYAYQTSVFALYVAPWTYEGWTYISYTLSDPSNNGEWCEKIGTVQVACQGGFVKYSKDVEVGMEAADTSAPENAGLDRTGVQHLDGNWYHWNEAEWRTENYVGEDEKAYVCAKGYEPGVAAYIKWGTPNNRC
jgi:hypothetical protein